MRAHDRAVTGTVEPRGPWNDGRRDLLGWLGENAPLACTIYEGAVAIIDDDGIPGRNYFIWHAVREIRAAIPRAINGPSRRFDADPHVKKLAAAWRADGQPLAAPASGLMGAEPGGIEPGAEPDPSQGPSTITISQEVAAAVVHLVNEFELGSTKFSDANQQALTNILGREVPGHIGKAWTDAFKLAPKFAHLPDKPPTIDELGNAVTGFYEFEDTLMTITRKSFENMDDLDAILASTKRS